MDYLFVIITTLILLLIIKRKFDNQKAELEFKYRIYELRDELRLEAIRNGINSSEWLFSYYDRSFSKLIQGSSRINLVTVLYYWSKHNDEIAISAFADKFEKETEQNPFYQNLRKDLLNATVVYIFNQNFLLINYIFKPALTSMYGWRELQKKVMKVGKSVLVNPETSDSANFLGRGGMAY